MERRPTTPNCPDGQLVNVYDAKWNHPRELLLRAKLVPDRAGADTQVIAHIPLSQLRAMPGAADLEDAWIPQRTAPSWQDGGMERVLGRGQPGRVAAARLTRSSEGTGGGAWRCGSLSRNASMRALTWRIRTVSSMRARYWLALARPSRSL